MRKITTGAVDITSKIDRGLRLSLDRMPCCRHNLNALAADYIEAGGRDVAGLVIIGVLTPEPKARCRATWQNKFERSLTQGIGGELQCYLQEIDRKKFFNYRLALELIDRSDVWSFLVNWQGKQTVFLATTLSPERLGEHVNTETFWEGFVDSRRTNPAGRIYA